MTGEVIASDLEGTLTHGETWRGLKAYFETHGRAAQYKRFAQRMLPMYLGARLGVVPRRTFQDRWIAALLGVVADVPLEEFQQAAAWVVAHELEPKIRQAPLEALLSAQRAGVRVVLASGTYQPVLEAFAAKHGFEAVGTPLEVANGRLTGRLAGAVNVGATKLERLRAHLNGATLLRAYGDTVSDVPMLEAAREAVVVRGNDARLERLALARGWTLLG
jgi:phosphoserine phosphatase